MSGRCCVCTSSEENAKNAILRCSQCHITVHQACYGVATVPVHRWFCKKCEPHSLIRASKVRCMFCPAKDGALKPITGAKDGSASEVWSHILCALWIPGLDFDDETARNFIDVSKHESGESATCMLCVEEGRNAMAPTGTCISCSSEGCNRKFHVTCAYKRGLLHMSTGRAARCSYCMMKKARPTQSKSGESEGKADSAAHRAPRKAAPRETAASKTASGKETSHFCVEPGCTKEYFSAQGLRYHLLHHHPERAHKGRAAADGGGATRRKRSVSTADSADDDLSNARSKARALDAHEGDASSAMSYSDAARSVCGSAELPALTADKNRLASAVREVVMEKMSEVHGDIGLLRRLDETQQATAVLIEQVGLLSRTRDELLAEVATLEETLPAELQSVQADRAAASRHTVAANLRGSLLHVLSYVAGGVAIHPTELPAVIKGVTAALAPRVPDADGDTAAAATAVLPPIQAMRQAILAVTNTEL